MGSLIRSSTGRGGWCDELCRAVSIFSPSSSHVFGRVIHHASALARVLTLLRPAHEPGLRAIRPPPVAPHTLVHAKTPLPQRWRHHMGPLYAHEFAPGSVGRSIWVSTPACNSIRQGTHPARSYHAADVCAEYGIAEDSNCTLFRFRRRSIHKDESPRSGLRPSHTLQGSRSHSDYGLVSHVQRLEEQR